MTVQPRSDYYARGLQLAEAGKHQEGLNCIQEHLRIAPQDAEALNDAGAILHCLGRTDDAIAYLTEARHLQGSSGEILWNLAEAYMAGGRAAEAAELFDEMERMRILNVDLLNRAATLLLDQDQKGPAIEVLLRSYRLWPEQEVLRPILEVVRSKRLRVSFFRGGVGEDGALADICEFVQQRFPTTFYDGRRPDGISALMEQCDIAWFDGGGRMLVDASQQGGPGRIIASLRRSDVRENWARDVRWENVSILVQIGSSAVEEALLQEVPDLRNRTRLAVIPNAVNLDRYALRRRERGKHLACMGRLTLESNPALLLQCMQKLHYIDTAYKLFFSGSFESPMLEQYVRHMVETLGLSGVVIFEPYPSDLDGWLSDKHYVVAGGIGESQVEGLLTGMACGLKPVIHNFPGAEKLFPGRYLFNIAEQFCEQVLGGDYDPDAYRRFIEEHFALAGQLRKVNGILTQLESEIELPPRRGLDGQGAAPGVGIGTVDGFVGAGPEDAVRLR
ncbi:MAG: tetratricopeptide repeat protein [Sedimentisphaerales bacterium]|nr:tetratricopeptide repeat protein [Sedimentisphaerales bacterium]